MEKRFKNSFELAYFFFEEQTDTRQWGILRPFEHSATYKFYFWDMQDKYVRGKSVMEQYFSREYKEAKFKAMSNFVDYIDKNLTFPLIYKSECVYADGYGADFSVQYIIDNQLTFDGMEMIQVIRSKR